MTDFDQCACTGINLDKLVQPTILLFLAEQDLHGYGLIQKIVDSPMFKGEKPDPTGIYRFLKSMEDRHLVMFSWDLAESGPAKKIYRITEEGMACLEQWISTLQEYLHSIQALVASAERLLEGSREKRTRAEPGIRAVHEPKDGKEASRE